MADLQDRTLLLAASLVMAASPQPASGQTTTPASVPAGQAENATTAHRAGRVPPAPGQAETPLKDMLAAVRRDAAQAFGLSPAGVRVEVQEAVWPDGALGCDLGGMAATQALEPGWRLTISGQAGLLATYHASKRGAWRLCAVAASGLPAVR